jgi:RND superfamily putative drug exporter
MAGLAGIGRWCFRHRWWVVALWVGAAVAGGLAAGPVSDALAETNAGRHLESTEARAVVAAATGAGEEVLGLVDRVDPAA